MESVKTQKMHVTEPKTIATVSRAEDSTDDGRKKLEDELLYGTEENADEEDALSDDSLRLRLSDEDGDDSGGLDPVNRLIKSVQPEALEGSNSDGTTGIEGGHHAGADTLGSKNESNKIRQLSTGKSISPDKPSVAIFGNDCQPEVKENGLPEKEQPEGKGEEVKFNKKLTTKDIAQESLGENKRMPETTGSNDADQLTKNPKELNIEEDLNITPTSTDKVIGKTKVESSNVNSTGTGPEETSASIDSDAGPSISKFDKDIHVKEEAENDIQKVTDSSSSVVSNEHDSFVKTGVKRPRSDGEAGSSVCNKKVSRHDSPKSQSAENQEEHVSLDVIQSEDCLEAPKIANVGDDVCELVNGEISDAKSLSPEPPMPALSIETMKETGEIKHEVPKLEKAVIEIPTKGKRKRRRKKASSPPEATQVGQEKENVRVRRETAQKAEELIRKKYLNDDSDSDLSESSTTSYNNTRSSTNSKASSPPVLKRSCHDDDDDQPVITKLQKKPKTDAADAAIEAKDSAQSETNKQLAYVRKFFLRDSKEPLEKPTVEQLEELLVQKIVETITMRDEIGKLKEQAKLSERKQEATRLKCQQLSRQIKDFDMVLARLACDRRGSDKNAPPIKINRSVGLQVNFLSDCAVQNLRQLQQTAKATAAMPPNGGIASIKHLEESAMNSVNGRKGLKVRSPRRSVEVATVTSPAVKPVSPLSQIHGQQSAVPATPTALVVTKKNEQRHPVASTGQVIHQPVKSNSQQTLTINGTVPVNSARPVKVLNVRSNNNNENHLIDLTGEEDKNKLPANPPPLTAITTVSKDSPSTMPKVASRYQRPIQPATSVTIAPTLRLMKSPDTPTPTAIVNNMNGKLLLMQGNNGGSSRQIVLTTTANRPAFAGVATINGSLRVIPAQTTTSTQKYSINNGKLIQHPAPLPGLHHYPIDPTLKLPPPAPALKISKQEHGIVLSWNMTITDKHAEIASYQLYAYQETNGLTPNGSMWKKVGDVRALPLPMACTLTQFSEGNNYYFAVRAVDAHSRLGQYSPPGNISL